MTDNSDNHQPPPQQSIAWPAITIPIAVQSTLRSVDEIANDIDAAEHEAAQRIAAEQVADVILPSAERVETRDIERSADGKFHCPDCDFADERKNAIGPHRFRRHSPPEVMAALGARIGAQNHARHIARQAAGDNVAAVRGQGRTAMMSEELERIVERLPTLDRSHLLKRRARAMKGHRNMTKWEADELAKFKRFPPTLVDYVTPASSKPTGRTRAVREAKAKTTNARTRPTFSLPELEAIVDLLPKQLRTHVMHGRADAIRKGRDVIEYERNRLLQIEQSGVKLAKQPTKAKAKTITSAVIVKPDAAELAEREERARADDLFERVARATDELFPERVPSTRILEVAGWQQDTLRMMIR
jgi:hypothetical protein